MKCVKWVVMFLVFALSLSLASCGESAETEEQPTAPGVVANPDYDDEIDRSERIHTEADVSAFEKGSEWEINDTINLTIADTLLLELNILNKSNPLRQMVSYSGTVTGDGNGDFTLSQDNSMYLGSIHLYTQNLRFQLVYNRDNGNHELFRLKQPATEADILD